GAGGGRRSIVDNLDKLRPGKQSSKQGKLRVKLRVRRFETGSLDIRRIQRLEQQLPETPISGLKCVNVLVVVAVLGSIGKIGEFQQDVPFHLALKSRAPHVYAGRLADPLRALEGDTLVVAKCRVRVRSFAQHVLR